MTDTARKLTDVLNKQHLVTLHTVNPDGHHLDTIKQQTFPWHNLRQAAVDMAHWAKENVDARWVITMYGGDSVGDAVSARIVNFEPEDWGKDDCEWEFIGSDGDIRIWGWPIRGFSGPEVISIDELDPRIKAKIREKLLAVWGKNEPSDHVQVTMGDAERVHVLSDADHQRERRQQSIASALHAEMVVAATHAKETHGLDGWWEDECARLHVQRAAATYVADYLETLMPQ